MPAGRPLKFQSVDELQEKIDAYFDECDPHYVDVERPSKDEKDEDGIPVMEIKRELTGQVPYTITGLALALDTSRETLLDYEEKEEYSDTIKKAKLKIHNFTELRLFGNNVTGMIFSLKNNYGWRDKNETDITTNGKDLPSPILGGIAKNVQPDDSNEEDSQTQ